MVYLTGHHVLCPFCRCHRVAHPALAAGNEEANTQCRWQYRRSFCYEELVAMAQQPGGTLAIPLYDGCPSWRNQHVCRTALIGGGVYARIKGGF